MSIKRTRPVVRLTLKTYSSNNVRNKMIHDETIILSSSFCLRKLRFS